MSTLATYSFTRADANPLPAPWAANTAESAMQIVTNAAVPTNVNADASELYTGVVWPNDQWSEITFSVTDNATNDTGAGAVVRCAPAAITWYRASGNLSGYTMYVALAGVYTLVTSGVGTTFTTGDALRLEIQGTTWRLKKNGVQFATGTDTTVASGSAGVSYSGSDNITGIGSWQGGDFSSGSPSSIAWIRGS